MQTGKATCKTMVFLFLLMFASIISSQAKDLSDLDLQYLIEKHELQHAFTGIKVTSLKKDKVLLTFNENKYFVPASNQKLITTWIALKRLGPTFKYQTEVYTNSKKEGGENNRYTDVLIKGGGDPTLVAAHLGSKMSHYFQTEKIGDIRNLILDFSYYDKQYFGPGWMWDDDNNFIASLSFPSLKRSLQSPYDTMSVLQAVGREIKSSLSEESINIVGNIKAGTLTSEWNKVITLTSQPLIEILTEMNKTSNNYYADMIWKSISANTCKGTFQDTVDIAKNELSSLGISNKVTFVDGSGLSRYNLITPTQISTLLTYAFGHPRIHLVNTFGYPYYRWSYQHKRNYFISTLPGWGSGTLVRRKYDLPVKAKTGTLTDTSTLSGYLETSQDVVAFSIMINRVKDIKAARRFQSDLLNHIYTLLK